MITDDIVYTRSQAKKLRKQGFVIPSYRVLAGKSERIARMGHGTGTAHGDRAVVAINSEMMQQRWTKWRDNNGTFIVPYYFAKNFPGGKEDQGTINSHIKWFNKELNQCLRLEEVNSFDMRYDSKIRIIDGNGCWSYIGKSPSWMVLNVSNMHVTFLLLLRDDGRGYTGLVTWFILLHQGPLTPRVYTCVG